MFKKLLPVSFCLISLSVFGQSGNIVSGGNATGGGGNVSYTVGINSFSCHSSTEGSVTEGFQHPYEIFIIAGLEHKNLNVRVNVFPNPVQDMIQITGTEKGQVCKLYDSAGKILNQKISTGSDISMEATSLASGIYVLKVKNNKSEIKSFKIIKR